MIYLVSEINNIQLQILTAHSRSVVFLITTLITGSLSSHPMRIQPVLPFPHLSDLLITMLVLLIAVRPSRIIDIIPVLNRNVLFFWLSLSFPAAPLSLLPASVEPVHVAIF